MDAAVVELDRLADPVRARAEHDDRAARRLGPLVGALVRDVVVRRPRLELAGARVDGEPRRLAERRRGRRPRSRAAGRRSTGGCPAGRARAAPPRAAGPSAPARGSRRAREQLAVVGRERDGAAASRPSIAFTNASANVRPSPSASPTARISAPSRRSAQRELLEVEARRLDRDVVERRLERRGRLAGDVVRQLVERVADREQRRELRDREAGRLRRERRRARHARVHLDHAELVASPGAPRTGRWRRRSRRRPRARSRTPPRAAAGTPGRGASAAARSSTSRRCARPSGRGSRSSRRRRRCRARRTSPRARAPASPRGTPRRAPGRPGSRRGPCAIAARSSSGVCATPPPRAAERERRPHDRRHREVDVGRGARRSSAAPGGRRPCTVSRKSSRSSARLIASRSAPISSTPRAATARARRRG